jgi:hypothetical protein
MPSPKAAVRAFAIVVFLASDAARCKWWPVPRSTRLIANVGPVDHGEVVGAADAAAGTAEVGAVDVQGDADRRTEVGDAMDVPGGREAGHGTGVVETFADRAEVFAGRVEPESFLSLDAVDQGDHAPGGVVVDAGRLSGTGDEGDDREGPVRFDVQGLAAVVAAPGAFRDAAQYVLRPRQTRPDPGGDGVDHEVPVRRRTGRDANCVVQLVQCGQWCRHRVSW